MADLTHPADEVPGGLWYGAPVRIVAASPDDPAAWSTTRLLRLSDPLGLGLAGLAARVAERCGDLGTVALPDYLPQFDTSAWWYNWPHVEVSALCRTASYLSLTDRLCAAVGLTLAPGEVAGWEYTTDRGWVLSTRRWSHAVPEANHTDDPIPALRAALAALEDDHADD